MLHFFFFFFILASMFTSAWRKLRAKVGHAWDKCCYICKKNQTTQLAGTIHAHHVQSWEVSVQPDNCLQATVFVNNTAPVYTGAAHSIHNLFCSHSRLEWKRGGEREREKKKLLSPFHPTLLNEENHFKKCGAENTHRSKNDLLCNSSSVATILNSIRHFIVYGATFSPWWSSFFFFFCKYLQRNTLIMFLEKWRSTRLQLWLTK